MSIVTLGVLAGVIEWAFGEAASDTIRRVLRKRLESAREILIEEMKAGKKFADEIPPEECASAVLRYLRAAEEGSAHRNLRLMAQTMMNLEP